jgi:hypothetical protein
VVCQLGLLHNHKVRVLRAVRRELTRRTRCFSKSLPLDEVVLTLSQLIMASLCGFVLLPLTGTFKYAVSRFRSLRALFLIDLVRSPAGVFAGL